MQICPLIVTTYFVPFLPCFSPPSPSPPTETKSFKTLLLAINQKQPLCYHERTCHKLIGAFLIKSYLLSERPAHDAGVGIPIRLAVKCNFQYSGGLGSSAQSSPPCPCLYLCRPSSTAEREGFSTLTAEVAPKRHAPFLRHLPCLSTAPADSTRLPVLFRGRSPSQGVRCLPAAGGWEQSDRGKSSCPSWGHGKAAGPKHSFSEGQPRALGPASSRRFTHHGTLENTVPPAPAAQPPHPCPTRFPFSPSTRCLLTAHPFPRAAATPA